MQVFPLCIPQNLWCSQMSVRVSFLIFISITIITVQGWPEDRELRDSYRLSDMATATTPTMVNGTIWKAFWFKVFPDDARSPWIRFATKTWMSADQVKQRSKRHLWHALWPGRRTICGTFVQHTFRDKNFVNFRDKMLFFWAFAKTHKTLLLRFSTLCHPGAHSHVHWKTWRTTFPPSTWKTWFGLRQSRHLPTVELHITMMGEWSSFCHIWPLLLYFPLLPYICSCSWSPGPDHREQACQTPKSHLSLSPLIPHR